MPSRRQTPCFRQHAVRLILIITAILHCLTPPLASSEGFPAHNLQASAVNQTTLVTEPAQVTVPLDKNGAATPETSNLFGVASSVDLNQSGDFAFLGLGQSALFLRRANPGTTVRVLQMGDPVPGIPGSQADLLMTPRLNNSAQLAFAVDYGTGAPVQRAILVFNGTSFQKIVSSSDIAPGTGGAIFGRLITMAGMNEAGDVAFTASLLPLGSTAAAQTTLFIVPSGGAPVRIAGPGDAAPGTAGVFANIVLPSTITSLNNNSGEVLFATQILGGAGGFGLFVGSTSGVRKVVANGDPIPGGGTFSITASPTARLNRFGQVAFSANNALWVHTPNTGIAKAVAGGDPAPVALGGTFNATVLSAFNDFGIIAFTANVAGSAVTSRGVFTVSNGNAARTVAFSNQTAAGASPATFATFSALSIGSVTGTVSFHATLVNGAIARGIFQGDGFTAPINRALEGQATPLAGGGTFNLLNTFITRTLDNGLTYFFADVIGGTADYAEFLADTGSMNVLMNDADTLPAGSKTSMRTFRVGAAGDYIGFVSQQTGGRFSLMVRNISTNVTSTVVTDGDVAPGTGGGKIRLSNPNFVYVNPSGTVAFPSQIIGGPQGISSGIFAWTQSDGISKLVAVGDLDPSTGSTFSAPLLNSFASSPVNALGRVVFRATVLNTVGIYVALPGGPVQRIAQNGAAAPGGGTFLSIGAVQVINQAGQVAFFATTTGGPGQNQGIFVGTPGGAVVKIAVSGDPAPGGGTFATFPQQCSFNDSGEVAFISTLNGGAGGGAFVGTTSSLQAVALNGASSPAGGNFSLATSLDILINNQHDVVFRAVLTGGSADSGYFLRRGASGALQTVVSQGQSVPGAQGTFVTIPTTLNNFLGENFALGPAGEVAFTNPFQTSAGSNVGAFRFRTDNLLEKIAVRGDVVPNTGNGVFAGSFQGMGAGGPGRFAFWIELVGGSVTDTIYLTNPVSGFSISGRVTDVSGSGISGVTVALSGTASGSTSTDSAGNYSLANLASGGNYTVTSSSGNFSFSPANQSFGSLNENGIANFVGTQTTVTISGKVTDSNNAGLGNVTLALTKNGLPAGTTLSDGSGNYSFSNLTAGANYVVTPAGSFTPSSQTLSNLTANATANFKAAPSIPSQCNATSFAAANAFPVAGQPFSVVAGDFNGDGKVDLASANANTNNVSVLLGNGAGGFSAPTNFAAGTQPYSIAVSDLNGDGKLDFAVVNQTSGNVSILLGDGAGSFGAPTNVSVGTGPRFVGIGDLNNDGKLDLVAVNRVSNNLSILLGDGLGGFALFGTVAVGNSPETLTLGDLNADGKLDAVVAIPGSLNSQILLGNGNGSFSAPANLTLTAGGAISSAIADLNGDGKLDVVITSGGSSIATLLGNGTGGFGAPTNSVVGSGPFSVVLADFNRDGSLDPAVTNVNADSISVLLGTGTGALSPQTTFATGAIPRSLVVSDFNQDGKLDLAVGSQTSTNISVSLNNGAACNTQSSLTISGRIADSRNLPLPEVTVTLSGPITRVVATDSNGNYTFANLIPGGNYSVTVQSSYFIFAPSRADFFNLSSSQVANFIAAPLAVPSPTPTPDDNFNGTTRDASKWSIGAQTSSTTAFDPQVITAQTNGQLVITPLTQASGLHFAGYVSANSFDLRNGSAKVEVVKAATGGADTIFAVGSDADNFYRFMVHSTGTMTSLAPRAKGRDGIERPLDPTVAQLVFQVNVGGQLTSLSIDYNPTLHRFMRFRHVPPANSIVFETSPDNVDFTVQHTVVLQKSVSALTAELSAGTSNPTNPGQTVFDNFGLVTSTFQFSAASYSVGEGDGSILVTVTRSGSLADSAAVDFATADGTARQKSRYTSAAGTLAFASGVASRTFRVLLVDNQLAEGEQTLNLLLSNPIGSGLTTPGRAVLTIVDNDSSLATTNSLDDARYFVTQHYYDFLSRVPDQGGLDFWVSQITLCGTDEACLRTQRITVSNAFFYEQEYQQTGSYVVRVYRAAYGNNQPIPNNDANPQFPNENKKLVNYSAFSPDRARVRGGPSLAQTQLDLANAFVLRPQFLARYPASLDGPAFVDSMLATMNNDIGVNLSSQRTALIDLFNQGGRGQVLYRLADDNATNPIANQAFLDAEYNRAFVLTQYFGYLRRNPDVGGFVFWLGQVNSAPLRSLDKQRAMVCSFITSLEYQQRFSPVATHNNTECQ